MKLAPTQSCYECGGTMEGHREDYKYIESGLKNVVLKDILVFRCKNCGQDVPEITGAATLHTLIGMRLLFKETRLNGDEIRFLRKLSGYSATEFARLAGTSKSVVSRWENRSTFGDSTDRLVRLICFTKMLQEILPASDGKHRRNNKTLIDSTALARSMEDALKKMAHKDGGKKRVEILASEMHNLSFSIGKSEVPAQVH